MKNLFLAAALGATALVPVSALAQQAQQPAQQQGQQMQQTQMQQGQVQEMAVSELMNREVYDEQGQQAGTVAGIVERGGSERFVLIEMTQDQRQVLLPVEQVSMEGDQLVAQNLRGAQEFSQDQQAEYQPVDEQQSVQVRQQESQSGQQMVTSQRQSAQSTQPMTTTQPAQQQMAAQPEMQDGFIVRQSFGQVMGDDLMEANVIGAEGESIGNVEDVLIDQDGRIIAVVVGIGGFLGIGERDVAISADNLNFVISAREGEAVATDTPVVSTDAPVATGTVGTTQPGAAPATTQPGAPATTREEMAAQRQPGTGYDGTGWGWGGEGQLQHIEVAFTREQLENAPEFTLIDESR